MVMHNWKDYIQNELKFLDTLDLKTIIKTCPSSEIEDVMNFLEINFNDKYVKMFNLDSNDSLFDNMDSYEFEEYLGERYKGDFGLEYVERRYIIFMK